MLRGYVTAMVFYSAELTSCQVLPFTALYDARDKFKSKKDMASFPASRLGPGDIGLLEVTFTRWKSSKEAKAEKGWTNWEVSFELQSFSVIFEAPPGANVDGSLAADELDDDM